MAALDIRTIASVWSIMIGFGTSRTEILNGCPCQTTARIVSFKAVISKRSKTSDSFVDGKKWSQRRLEMQGSIHKPNVSCT